MELSGTEDKTYPAPQKALSVGSINCGFSHFKGCDNKMKNTEYHQM